MMAASAENLRIAVLGAGHGGKAMAADLAASGHYTNLYNRTPEHIEAIRALGGITLRSEDDQQVFGELQVVSSDIAAVLDSVDLIMVVVPAFAHDDIGRMVAPYLQEGQIIVLNPGRTGGTLAFRRNLNEAGCDAAITLAEAGTFLFASRSTGPTEAHILRSKKSVQVAALPATETNEVMQALSLVYRQFVAAPNTLTTSLNNMGAVFHPALSLLNTGWIESTGKEFKFYVQGVTRSTVRVLELIDRERIMIAAALGADIQTGQEWLVSAYEVTGDTLYEMLRNNPGYQRIQAPSSLQHRYIAEDVPYSLVPLAALGTHLGVEVPTMEAIIQLACGIHGANYFIKGRTLERMGLSGLSVEEINRLVSYGYAHAPDRAQSLTANLQRQGRTL